MTSNVGVTWDRVQNLAGHGTLKGEWVRYRVAILGGQL